MPGPNRRNRRLKQATQLTEISEFTSVNPVNGDLLIFDSTDGVYENGKALLGDYTFTGAQSITGSLAVSDDITIGDALTVSGNTSLQADLAVQGAASLNSSLAVGTTLSVTGAATLSDNLSVAGATSVAGFSASGAAQFDTNVNVDGTLTAATLSLTDLSLSGDLSADNGVFSGNVSADNVTAAAAVSGNTVSGQNVTAGISVSAPQLVAGDMFLTTNLIDIGGTSGTLSINLDDATDTELTPLVLSADDEQDMSGTVGGLILPGGTTAQQPGTPIEGTVRYNSTDLTVEAYVNSTWTDLAGGGSIALDDLTDVNVGSPGAPEDGYVLTWVNASSEYQLVAPSGGSSLVNFQDNGLAGEWLYNSTVIASSNANGIEIIDPSASSPLLFFRAAGTEVARIQRFSDGNLYMDNRTTAGDTIFRVTNTSTSDYTGVRIRRTGPVELYSAGNLVARTQQFGLDIAPRPTQTLAALQFWNAGFAAQEGVILTNLGGAAMTIRSNIHGGLVTIDGENALGTAQLMFQGDPDGSVDLYWDGGSTPSLQTQLQGITVQHSAGAGTAQIRLQGASGSAAALNFNESTVTKTQLIYDAVANEFEVRTTQSGERTRFFNDVGGDQLILNAGGSVILHHAGSIKLDTDTAGFNLRSDDATKLMSFFNIAGTQDYGDVIVSQGNYFGLIGREHGVPITLWAENNSGVVTRVFNGDPDAAANLYNAGSLRLSTASSGAIIDASDATLTLRDGGSETTILQKLNSGNFRLINQEHGGSVLLQAEDSGGVTRSLLVGDPDGSLDLYYAGSQKAETIDEGFRVNEILHTPVDTELTISAGAITVTRSYHTVDTEADAATDDLDTINGGAEGAIIVLRANNSARTVVLKDNTGNLRLAGDFSLDNNTDMIMLHKSTANWHEISRSDNGA